MLSGDGTTLVHNCLILTLLMNLFFILECHNINFVWKYKYYNMPLFQNISFSICIINSSISYIFFWLQFFFFRMYFILFATKCVCHLGIFGIVISHSIWQIECMYIVEGLVQLLCLIQKCNESEVFVLCLNPIFVTNLVLFLLILFINIWFNLEDKEQRTHKHNKYAPPRL